jgi:hypothetical protein
MTRRWLTAGLGLAAVLMLAVAGCGSSGQAPEQEAAVAAINEACAGLSGAEYTICTIERSKEEEASTPSEPVDTTEEEPPEEVGGPLKSVGTITASVAPATVFRDHFLLGPLLYSDKGTPPEAVLNACGINDPSLIARSVFARGQVTIKYEEGSLPTPLGINFSEVVRGSINGRVALRIDGNWQCGNEPAVSLEFEPGESKSFPLWVIAIEAVSNAQPRVPKEALDTWHFDPIGVYDAEDSESEISGPGTGQCENEFEEERYMLLLYNRSGHC